MRDHKAITPSELLKILRTKEHGEAIESIADGSIEWIDRQGLPRAAEPMVAERVAVIAEWFYRVSAGEAAARTLRRRLNGYLDRMEHSPAVVSRRGAAAQDVRRAAIVGRAARLRECDGLLAWLPTFQAVAYGDAHAKDADIWTFVPADWPIAADSYPHSMDRRPRGAALNEGARRSGRRAMSPSLPVGSLMDH